ncbi:MAG: YtxH domain-containing protein [Acidobacteriia bacterium]|nr:YtxH domain-containing protein [Terriglobia bacterium]
MSEGNDNGSKLLYFVIGGGVGAIIALLFAPRSGKETRELIAHKAVEGKEYLTSAARNVQEKASGVLDQTKESLTQKRSQISAAIEAGKQAYREEKSKAN